LIITCESRYMLLKISSWQCCVSYGYICNYKNVKNKSKLHAQRKCTMILWSTGSWQLYVHYFRYTPWVHRAMRLLWLLFCTFFI
jgi:hypothetical protein